MGSFIIRDCFREMHLFEKTNKQTNKRFSFFVTIKTLMKKLFQIAKITSNSFFALQNKFFKIQQHFLLLLHLLPHSLSLYITILHDLFFYTCSWILFVIHKNPHFRKIKMKWNKKYLFINMKKLHEFGLSMYFFLLLLLDTSLACLFFQNNKNNLKVTTIDRLVSSQSSLGPTSPLSIQNSI